MRKDKTILNVSIIGFGNIGKFICGALLAHVKNQLIINVIDTDENVIGAFKDLQDASQLQQLHQLSFNSTSQLDDADFIFHCAGASVPKGESRLTTCSASIEITEQVFQGFEPKKNPFIIVLANPVEIITYVTQKITQLPKEKVVGTGTLLDSIRMNQFIHSKHQKFESIDTVLLGEHGSTVFLSSFHSKIDNKAVEQILSDRERTEAIDQVKRRAEQIKETQDATIYGVAHCALTIFNALVADNTIHLPVSTFIPETLASRCWNKHVSVSLMAEIRMKGIKALDNYVPNEDEMKLLNKSIIQIHSCIPDKYL